MKKNISYRLGFSIAVLVVSCSPQSSDKDSSSDLPPEKNESSIVVMQKEEGTLDDSSATHVGLSLIQNSDCAACHDVSNKLVGPSYENIAEKYKASIEEEKVRLIKTVIDGGYGVWGDVPMTPHPQHSEAEVGEMVDYIMTFAQ